MPPAHFKTSRRGNFTSSLLQMPAANGGSFGFDVGELVYFRPLLGFVGDEFAEVGGRAGKHAAAEIVEALAHLGIVKRGIDLFVELGDDVRRRSGGRGDTIPTARLVTRQELGDRRNI